MLKKSKLSVTVKYVVRNFTTSVHSQVKKLVSLNVVVKIHHENRSVERSVGQCTPGIIAVNTATFIGYKHRGIPGGVLTTLGVVFPSLVIITAIAAFLSNFADIPVVQHALAGINAAVVALIAASVLKLGKSTLKNGAAIAIFLCVLALAAAGSLVNFGAGTLGQALDLLTSPAVLIVLAGAAGFLLYGRKKGGEGK